MRCSCSPSKSVLCLCQTGYKSLLGVDVTVCGNKWSSCTVMSLPNRLQEFTWGYLCNSLCTNGAMNFHWFKLYLPQNALPEEVSKCLINIKASPTDQFKLHGSYESDGAVYWVAIPGRFTKPLIIESIVPISAIQSAIHILHTSCAWKFLQQNFNVRGKEPKSLVSKSPPEGLQNRNKTVNNVQVRVV